MIDLSPEWLELREAMWQAELAGDPRQTISRGCLNTRLAALQRGTMPDQRRWQNLGRAR